MKAKILMVALFATIAWGTHAQSDDSTYINKAVEKLAEGDCQSAQRYYNVYKELSGKTIKYLENEIKDCFAQKERQSATSQNLYLSENRNKYVAWGIIGSGYPWELVSSIEFRTGGIVGFGLYGNVGADFMRITVNNLSNEFSYTTKTTFSYEGGIKVYLYKGLFLDCGYGTISKPTDNVNYDYGSGLSSDDIVIVKRMAAESSSGLLFHLGYNFIGDLSNGDSGFLGINGGVSYDFLNKEFAPSINIKFGMAWGQ